MPERPRLVPAVFLGGALGGLARHGLAEAWGAGAEAGAWPWGTLVANIAGAFLLGLVLVGFAQPHRRRLPAALGPGLCGALTTFSALQIEAVRLADDGHPLTAAVLLVVTVCAGYAAFRAGETVAARRPPGAAPATGPA